MAFNPTVPGLFAVCSADLSVDLWQYTRKNNELERVWTRQEATPIGGVRGFWMLLAVTAVVARKKNTPPQDKTEFAVPLLRSVGDLSKRCLARIAAQSLGETSSPDWVMFVPPPRSFCLGVSFPTQSYLRVGWIPFWGSGGISVFLVSENNINRRTWRGTRPAPTLRSGTRAPTW